MIDKLPHLLKLSKSKGINLDKKLKEKDNENNKEINKFMAKVSLTNGYLKNMNQIIIQLQKLKSELKNAVSDKEKEISSQISFLISKFIEQQQLTKHIIDENTEFIKENEKSSFLLEQEKRIVSNLQGSLIKNFQETVNKFQILQNSVKKTKQSMTLREAGLWMGRDLNDSEKLNVLNDPTIIQEMIKSKFNDPASQKFKNAVSDIEERHNDLIKLEKNINQVHQMFLQVASLVVLQGELIDNIAENISHAKQDVMHAEDDVLQSKKNMISARKKKCCIIITLIVIILFIVGPVLGVKVFSA